MTDFPFAVSSASEHPLETELEQRLGLYQVFLKLYEHHRHLLNEILDLENSHLDLGNRSSLRFVQGVVEPERAYLTTNLLQGRTQSLHQPEGIWTIGRDRQMALPIADKQLSRRHAVIQHLPGQGFCLLDLGSTNGTYVNGNPIRRTTLLRDGDMVRLGRLTFTFFLCTRQQTLAPVASPLLQQIQQLQGACHLPDTPWEAEEDLVPPLEVIDENLSGEGGDDTSMLLLDAIELTPAPPQSLVISPSQQANILDRFLEQQAARNGQESLN